MTGLVGLRVVLVDRPIERLAGVEALCSAIAGAEAGIVQRGGTRA
jgi:hypothetical protein